MWDFKLIGSWYFWGAIKIIETKFCGSSKVIKSCGAILELVQAGAKL